MKRLLFRIQHPPYSASLAQEAVEAVLASSVFEPPMDVLFQGRGILQLLPGQQSEERSAGANWEALPMFGIEQVLVLDSALKDHHLDPVELILPVRVLDEDAARALLRAADQVLDY